MKSSGSSFVTELFLGGSWIVATGERSTSVTTANEQVDTTDKDGVPWRGLTPCGIRNAEISLSGLMTDGAVVDALQTAAFNGTLVEARVVNGLFEVISEGYYIVTTFERGGEFNTAETFSASLSSASAAVSHGPIPFQITVDTTKISAGSTAATHFKLPLTAAGSYNATVSWGDGTISTITAWNQAEVDHTYAAPGVYTVDVLGRCTVWSFNNTGDRLKVLSVLQWGEGITSGLDFYGCSNLVSVAGSLDDYPRVTNFTNAFRGCSGLTSFPLIDTSNVTILDNAFRGCSGLTSFPAIDTSKVINFSNAWFSCSGLTSFPLLDTSKGTTVSYAWYGCVGLTSFPLLDTSLAASFNGSWSACSGLTSFPLLPHTSNVTDFTSAWQGCSGLTSFPLIDTSKGTAFAVTWSTCSGLTSFPLLDTSKGTNFASAWAGCSGLTSFPLLNTGKGTGFNSAWSGCTGLAGYAFPTLDMHLMTNGTSCFGTTGGGGAWAMSLSAYDAMLNQLANGDGGGIPANVTSNTAFSGGNSKYTAAAVAGRATLTATRSWTITDGGL